MIDNLTVGTKMYNHGDMANPDHFGTITRVIKNRWGVKYEITKDEGSAYEYGPYIISAVQVSEKYLGNGMSRIVTKDAYMAFREECMAAYRHNDRQNRIR